ncbi:hypothetical protein HPB50_007950 [Hyalomma asiaticum]|uniref:Uncharacterized protein n=1 Tax=Hyalomma asiaticum TaxID=266040 RepID=A0ACB7T1M2_HYAAI|nr:hypothetical protein HPB50_007950 [Hyalomma asiaticum]
MPPRPTPHIVKPGGALRFGQPSRGGLFKSGQLHKEPFAVVGTPVQADRVLIGRENAPHASFDSNEHRNSH